MTETIHRDGSRGQSFSETNAFLQRLRDLFMVQACTTGCRSIGGDKRWSRLPTSPAEQPGAASDARRRRCARSAAIAAAWVRNSSAISCSSAVQSHLLAQHLIPRGEFLHLPDVIGEAFRCRIDRGQAAADHHHGKTQLQVRDRRSLRGPRQLQAPSGNPRPDERRGPARSEYPAPSVCRRPCTERCDRSPCSTHRRSSVSRRLRNGCRRNARTCRAAPVTIAPVSGSSCSSAR